MQIQFYILLIRISFLVKLAKKETVSSEQKKESIEIE